MASPGDTIDQYRLESELGAGGFGTVFRAVHIVTGQVVALKMLHPQHLGSPRVVERFLAEAQAGQLRGEPHIVEIFDAGRTPTGEAFIAMELLTGEPLDERLEREAPLRGDVALHVAVQVLEGLAAAHRQGVVHRDLKPANVFLVGEVGDAAPTVKLLDFGVSKFTREAGSPSLTKTGMILGTPLYMAPEQFLRVKTVDGRADLYSASVLLYTMLSGHMPFAAESYEELVIRINTTAPTPLGAVAPWLPAGLRHLIERGLCRDPDGRFRSAEEYIAALGKLATANTIEVLRLGRGTVADPHLAPPTPHLVPAAAPASAPGQATPVVRSAKAYEATVAAVTPDHPSTRQAEDPGPAAPWTPGAPSRPAAQTPSPFGTGAGAGTGTGAGRGIAAVAVLGVGGAVVAGLTVVGILTIASAPDSGDPAGDPARTEELGVMPVESGGSGEAPHRGAPPSVPPAQTGQPAAPGTQPPGTGTGTGTGTGAGTGTGTGTGAGTGTGTGTGTVTAPPAPTAPTTNTGGRARVRFRGLSPTFHAADGRAVAARAARVLGRCAPGSTTRLTVQVLYSGSGQFMSAQKFPAYDTDATSDCVVDGVGDVAAAMEVGAGGVFFLDVVLDP